MDWLDDNWGDAAAYRVARSILQGRELPALELREDVRQRYGGPRSEAGECRARLYVDASEGALPVMVMSDLHKGMSIMNGAEDLCTLLTLRFSLPAETLWIYHIPTDNPDTELGAERYFLVTFDPSKDTEPGETGFMPLSEEKVKRLRKCMPLPSGSGDE